MHRDEDHFFDDEFDDDLDLGPVPHPDDRLWRHPSELASVGAASASLSPSDDRPNESSRSRVWRWARPIAATAAAAALIAVGVSRFDRFDAVNAGELAASDDLQSEVGGLSASTVRLSLRSSDHKPDEAQWRDHLGSRLVARTPVIVAVSVDGATEQSGLFVNEDGYVVTSARGLRGAETVVVINGGMTQNAAIVGFDAVADLAVLDTGQMVTEPAPLLTNSMPYAGDPVVLSDPIDRNDPTVGRVVATQQRFDSSSVVSFFDALHIELDGAEQPPLGLPLHDDTGSVVGIVAATSSDSSGHVVAIPARTIQRVANAIIDDGAAEWPWIGSELTVSAATSGTNVREVAVASVVPQSPADVAGLAKGDRIISIDGDPATSLEMVGATIQSSTEGDSIDITVDRMGDRLDLTLTPLNRADDLTGKTTPTKNKPTPVPTP